MAISKALDLYKTDEQRETSLLRKDVTIDQSGLMSED